ncbi:MAG: hypothetical protein ACI9Y7_002628 [Dokdonia sp.]|jgi:hypothetical protein
MSSRITFVGMVVLLLLSSSCQESGCYKSQRNQILGKNEYNSKVYQEELYRLIIESSDVDYYFEMREEIFGQSYLVINAFGDAFCGKLCLMIPEEDTTSITLKDSAEFQGAQLIGLRYNKHKTDYGSALVYDSVEYIVD